MQSTHPAAIETNGTTRVLGCCTFLWSETNGRRVVWVPEGAHTACIAELERAAAALGVGLSFVRRETTPP